MRIEITVGDKVVDVVIERLPLQPGAPYAQKITATHGGHSLSHIHSHGVENFHAADAKSEIARISKELADRVAGMSDAKAFLDDFHAGDSVSAE